LKHTTPRLAFSACISCRQKHHSRTSKNRFAFKRLNGIFVKNIAKGETAPQAIGTAIISEYMTTVTNVLIKKKLFNRKFTPQMLTDLYGDKPFFMAEIKMRFPDVFKGMSDEGVKKAYDAAIGMAFDKLKERKKRDSEE